METELRRSGENLTLAALGRESAALFALWRLPLISAVGGLTALYTAADTLIPEHQQGSLQAPLSIAGFVVAYTVSVGLLKASGSWQGDEGRRSIFAYFGLSLVIGLATLLGFVLFVFPGLFITARWMIAYPILLAEGETVGTSMSKSWEATANAWPRLIAAVFILGIPLLMGVGISLGIETLTGPSPVSAIILNLGLCVWSVGFVVLGIAAYRTLIDRQGGLADVFA